MKEESSSNEGAGAGEKVKSSEESTVVVTEAEVTEVAEEVEEAEVVQEETKEADESPPEEEKEPSVKDDESLTREEDSTDSLGALEEDSKMSEVEQEEERFFNSVPEARINWLKAFDDNFDNRRQSLSSAGFKCDSLRRSTGPCSKDTLLYIDQQSHPALDDEDSSILSTSHSLWVS